MASAYIEMEVPEFLSSRNAGKRFVQDFVAVPYMPVIIDFANNKSVAQGACDEIVKQLLSAEVPQVFLINQTDIITRWFATAVELRDENAQLALIA